MTLHIGYKSPFRTNLLPTNLSGNGLFLFLYNKSTQGCLERSCWQPKHEEEVWYACYGSNLSRGTVLLLCAGRRSAKRKRYYPGDCDGQSGYGVSKLDSIVEEVVRQIFAQFREVSRKKLLESVKTNDAARIQKKIKKIQKDLEAKQKELDDLKAETILVTSGP